MVSHFTSATPNTLMLIFFSQARDLFLKGASLERSGDHFSAILHYKKAEQLVPNIDRVVFKEDLERAKEKERRDHEEKGKEYRGKSISQV